MNKNKLLTITDKTEILLILKRCHTFNQKYDSTMNAMIQIEEKKWELEYELKQLKTPQYKKIVNIVIGGCLYPLMLGLVSLIATPLTLIAPSASLLINLLTFIVSIPLCIRLSKPITDKIYKGKETLNHEKIVELQNSIEVGEKALDRANKKIDELMNSDEASYVAKMLPPDYQSTEAIERFIFYFQNGHVDTMKEALHEYDNYKYQQEMKEKAERQAIASEEGAEAAAEAARAARDTAIEAKKAAFWSMYNAYLTEERYNK